MKRIGQTILSVLGARWFTRAILVFFCIEALWVALSAVYPMAFDEDFHLGIIKIYSHQWLPFLSDQPDSTGRFGAIARDPSYLYHWLMSFPYRFIAAITDNQAAQVIFLRLINIGLFAWGLVLFRKVLIRVGTSHPLTNTALALFVLIPIVPVLAGQINYDNLLLPIVAGLCLVTFSAYEDIRARKVRLRTAVWFVVLCMLGSLVKYAFVPLAFAAALFLGVALVRAFWKQTPKLWNAIRQSFRGLGTGAKWGLLVVVIASSVLFIQRYGLNVASYHTPLPDCAAVLNNDACMAYGPWARNHMLAESKGEVSGNPLAYAWTWMLGMHFRLFFSVNGPASGFINYPPAPLPSATAVVIGVCGMVAVLLYFRQVFRGQPYLRFLLLLILVYAGVLWLNNYSEYLETGQPVAINGRYLLLILLPLAAIFGRALSIAFKPWPRAKAWAAAIVILLFMQGGGVSSFILRSDTSWYWPNRVVERTNNAARTVLQPLIFEGNKYY